jgi:hypothetical protein
MSRLLCGLLIVALLAPFLYLAAEGQQGHAGSPAGGEQFAAGKFTLKGVPQFIEVTPKLYRGGQPTEEGFDSLAKMGIGIVVDLRGSRKHERELVTKLGMEYVPLHGIVRSRKMKSLPVSLPCFATTRRRKYSSIAV